MSFLSGLFGFLEYVGLAVLIVVGAWFLIKKCLKGGVALIIAIIVAAILSSFFGSFAGPKPPHGPHAGPAGGPGPHHGNPEQMELRDATQAAFDNPTDENVRHYLDVKNDLMQKAKKFADKVGQISNEDKDSQDN